MDTIGEHYWNYRLDPKINFPDWGKIIYSDYQDFYEESLKICVELDDESLVREIAASVPNCDVARFSDGNWYKFTTKNATKEEAIHQIADWLAIKTEAIIAFGDDFVDIEMLKICGNGIAMGNAIEEVTQIADDITQSNDEDGVAKYLEKLFLHN